MGLDFPPEPRRPRQPKQPKKSSGGGDRRTVGMAIAIFGSAAAIGVTSIAYVVIGHITS